MRLSISTKPRVRAADAAGSVPLLHPFRSCFPLSERGHQLKVVEGSLSLSSLAKKLNFVPSFSPVYLLSELNGRVFFFF